MNPLSHVEHLALYTAFHRSHHNRMLHIAAQACVLYGGACVALPLCWPAVVAVLVLHTLSMVRLHRWGGAMTGLVSTTLVALAWLTSTVVPPLLLGALGAALHVAGWVLLVVVGHQHLEPTLDTPEGAQDSNLYFREQLYLGRNLGTVVNALDGWTQFAIAPLASAWDLLELLGVQNPDAEQIAAQRDEVLRRLARGERPFARRSTQTLAPVGATR